MHGIPSVVKRQSAVFMVAEHKVYKKGCDVL